MIKMAKMASGEMVVGEFIERIETPMMIEIKNPMVVGLYAHPQDQTKIMIDMAPWNPFATKNDSVEIQSNKVMFYFPTNDKIEKITNQYIGTVSNIIIPEVQK